MWSKISNKGEVQIHLGHGKHTLHANSFLNPDQKSQFWTKNRNSFLQSGPKLQFILSIQTKNCKFIPEIRTKNCNSSVCLLCPKYIVLICRYRQYDNLLTLMRQGVEIENFWRATFMPRITPSPAYQPLDWPLEDEGEYS